MVKELSAYELSLKRRSIRQFKNTPVPYGLLEKCVNAARLAPSAANWQPLEYIIVDNEPLLPRVFELTNWATFIRPEGDPPPGHRPMAYVVVLSDTRTASKQWEMCDVGLSVENMILVALEEGVGSCCLGSVDKDKLRVMLNIPADYNISLVLALGYPDESPVVEDFNGSIKYWKDKDKVLHVPKRVLKDILHRNRF